MPSLVCRELQFPKPTPLPNLLCPLRCSNSTALCPLLAALLSFQRPHSIPLYFMLPSSTGSPASTCSQLRSTLTCATMHTVFLTRTFFPMILGILLFRGSLNFEGKNWIDVDPAWGYDDISSCSKTALPPANRTMLEESSKPSRSGKSAPIEPSLRSVSAE